MRQLNASPLATEHLLQVKLTPDGWLDVYLVQGGSLVNDAPAKRTGDRLFRNLGNGRFQDMTTKAGLDKFPRGYGHGVAIGD